MTNSMRRRDFLATTAAGAALAASPIRARAADPSSKLRTAHIGVGGMGNADLNSIASHPMVEVAALCDVDRNRLAAAKSRHAGAEAFADYRELFDALADRVDAVVVSTPDHTHAPAAMMALRLGKPVYCQKPLTHEVYEARRLREVAAEAGAPTQMGIQIHSAAPYRRARQMIQEGVIGKVSAVHAWSNKNWGLDGKLTQPEQTPPESLDWNLWLGSAEDRPYRAKHYHPAAWRKLVDFGTGTLGDMGVHIFDTPFAALALTAPNWVITECRPPTGVGHPERNKVTYEFPGTPYTTDKLSWVWYDGADAPPQAKALGLPETTPLPPQANESGPREAKTLPSQGSVFIGEEGRMLLPHIGEPRLFPQEKFADYQAPQVADGNHYHEWIDACLGQGQCSADFEYGGRLTEALLLGVVANRFPNEKLEWDAAGLTISNAPQANALLKRPYRQSFRVEGL